MALIALALQKPIHQDPPCMIILTGKSTTEEEERALEELQVKATIRKPFGVEELKKTVNALLRNTDIQTGDKPK